jgi:hypothetical protein
MKCIIIQFLFFRRSFWFLHRKEQVREGGFLMTDFASEFTQLEQQAIDAGQAYKIALAKKVAKI